MDSFFGGGTSLVGRSGVAKGLDDFELIYSLEGYLNTIGVAEWQQQLEQALPESIAADLPTIEEIERELEEGGDE